MTTQNGLVLLVVGIVAIAIFAATMRKNYETTLRQVCGPLGLSYDRLQAFGVGMGHQLRGIVDGRPFELAVAPFEEGNGVLCERWSIQLCGALPAGFAAGKNGWLRSASEGMTQVKSGDAEFDKKVMVEGLRPQEAYWVVEAASRRAALRDLAAMNGLVFENKVMLNKVGFDNNPATLQARLTRLRQIAQTIDPMSPPG
jgi:hypothetical protein